MTFQDLELHPIIVRNLGMMGYVEPKPIQAQAISSILAGHDVIGLAQTGTGKTAAFITPIVHRLISSKPAQRKGKSIEPMTRLRALVLCPTRELAQQVAEETAAIIQGSVLRSLCVYGKVALSPQVAAIAKGIDILIATPGRVRELLESGALSLAYVRHIAIDEADRMLDMGFLPQVTAILQSIPARAESDNHDVPDARGDSAQRTTVRQTVLFTATMPEEVEQLAGQFLHEPVRIEIGRHTTPVEHVKQHLLPVEEDDKVEMLLHLLAQGERRGVLVFCRTKRRVGWVGTALQRHGLSVGMLHGDRSQTQRKKALDRFDAGELRVLVATDVAGRGLHITAVKTVVNYDLPLEPQEYVHRIGRAAHGRGDGGGGKGRGGGWGGGKSGGGEVGESFTFLSSSDKLYWRAILRIVGVEVYAEELEGFKPSIKARQRKRVDPINCADAPDEDRPESNRAIKRRKDSQKRRSKKGRPIKKGQLPGQGVIKPKASS